MQDDKKIDVLFQILSSEQQTLQRVDQKAFTMLSLLGVFAVFFIIHYIDSFISNYFALPKDVFYF